VVAEVPAQGTVGAWRGLGSFDSFVLAASGIALLESKDGGKTPGALESLPDLTETGTRTPGSGLPEMCAAGLTQARVESLRRSDRPVIYFDEPGGVLSCGRHPRPDRSRFVCRLASPGSWLGSALATSLRNTHQGYTVLQLGYPWGVPSGRRC
jgi:hypothetical protein